MRIGTFEPTGVVSRHLSREQCCSGKTIPGLACGIELNVRSRDWLLSPMNVTGDHLVMNPCKRVSRFNPLAAKKRDGTHERQAQYACFCTSKPQGSKARANPRYRGPEHTHASLPCLITCLPESKILAGTISPRSITSDLGDLLPIPILSPRERHIYTTMVSLTRRRDVIRFVLHLCAPSQFSLGHRQVPSSAPYLRDDLIESVVNPRRGCHFPEVDARSWWDAAVCMKQSMGM